MQNRFAASTTSTDAEFERRVEIGICEMMRKFGAAGGHARRDALTRDQRRANARLAARAKWGASRRTRSEAAAPAPP
jgi:hypothetical protein